MKFHFLAAVATALAVFTASSDVQAAYVTSNGTIAVRADDPEGVPGLNPPISSVERIFFQNGQLFTNQVNGAPFATNSTIRTVGVARLTGAGGADGASTGTLRDPATGRPILAIFAVEGTIAGFAGGNPVGSFTQGSLFFTVATPGLNLLDPTTWNFAGSFAEYSLESQDDVIPGLSVGVDGGNFSQSAGNMNESQGVITQNRGDGTFVFGDSPIGAGFISDVELPGGGTSDRDFMVASTTQIFQENPYILTPAQQAALNLIGSQAGFGGAWNEGGYNPTPRGLDSGDFNAELAATVYIAAVVPEPSSIAIFGLLCGGAAVRFTKRRLQKA